MKKYLPITLWLVALSVCLLSCGNQEASKRTDNRGTTAPSHDIGASETMISENAGKTKHIFEKMGENLSVDAEVIIPEKTEYSTYTLKMVDCDPDRLFSLFCPENHESYTTENRSNCLVYNKASGQRLVVYEDAIDYSACDYDSTMQVVENLMFYYSEDGPQVEPHDLSFMNVEEMEKRGTALLTQLGISWEPKLFRCITLSGQEILDYQEQLFQAPTYTEFGDVPVLTEAQDTCYLQFDFSYDGIPLFGFEEPTAESYVNSKGIRDVTATIMFNSDGVQTCMISHPCIIMHVTDSQPILNIDEATTLLRDKYDLQIIPAPLEVTNVWMEYIPINQDGEVTLTPYWCFVAKDKNAAGFPNYFGEADRFNSITGKDLAYGG